MERYEDHPLPVKGFSTLQAKLDFAALRSRRTGPGLFLSWGWEVKVDLGNRDLMKQICCSLEMVTAVATLKLFPDFGGSERRNKAGFLRACCNKTGLGVTAVLPSLHLVEMSE